MQEFFKSVPFLTITNNGLVFAKTKIEENHAYFNFEVLLHLYLLPKRIQKKFQSILAGKDIFQDESLEAIQSQMSYLKTLYKCAY